MSKRRYQLNVSPFKNDVNDNNDDSYIESDVNVDINVNVDVDNDGNDASTGTSCSSILKNRSDRRITYHDNNTLSDVTKEHHDVVATSTGNDIFERSSVPVIDTGTVATILIDNNTNRNSTKRQAVAAVATAPSINSSLKKPNNNYNNNKKNKSTCNTNTIVGNNQHGLSSQANNYTNNNNTNNYNTTNNYNNSIVIFDVGGRIFKVRRSVIDSFPDTMLARCSSDIWLSSSSASAGSASSTSLQLQQPTQQQQQQQQPIFIDRDSHRFSYVLDYMRDNCTVELPVTISKESFIRELQYFGFDISTSNSNSSNNAIDCITCAIPTYEAVMQVDKLHNNFCYSMKHMELEKNYTIVAYACFCEFVYHRTVHCTFRANHNHNNNNNNSSNITNSSSSQLQFGQPMYGMFNYNNNINSTVVDSGLLSYTHKNLLPSMTSIATKLPDNVLSLLSSTSIYSIAKSLSFIYEQHKDCTTCYNHTTTKTTVPTTNTITGTSTGSSTSSGSSGNTINNNNNHNTNHNNILLFDKCLSEYGFHCQNIQYCSSSYSVSIHLKQI